MALILILQNISNLASISDYDFKVLVGEGTREWSDTIVSGVIHNHTRDDGWRALVQKLIDITE